jgi:hypothetical protein
MSASIATIRRSADGQREYQPAEDASEMKNNITHDLGCGTTGLMRPSRLPLPPQRQHRNDTEMESHLCDSTLALGKMAVSAHAPPNFQTGMRRRLALSARLS